MSVIDEQRVPIPTTKRTDWQSDQEVRWCPGCGDYSILAAMQPERTIGRGDGGDGMLIDENIAAAFDE